MSIRTERVSALLKQDLGDILQKEYQHGGMITVTQVRISPDLMQAHVYLSILAPKGDESEHFNFILERTAEIRKKLAGRVRHQLRRVPELHFHRDDTADYVEKIDSLFRKIDGDRSQSQDEPHSDQKNDGPDSSNSEA
ncbi:30S ribosome-binding factor RbfA [Balneolaceae bacterium ANBcel3]|nr:30S ribosome-binding factor RbfA [Balneolaceae bacterium ANBcel3]